MSTQCPFRFGAQIWESASGAQWQAKARKAEQLGYDILVMPDHFGNIPGFAPALAAAAAATTTLRIGTNVLDNDFRHPALVATDAATLDLLSKGRFELGIGAGWDQADYDQSGIPFDRPGVRVHRLEESVRIIKALLAGDAVYFAGQHYAINGLRGYPLPVQHPLPILIGAASPRLTAFAAREATIVSILPRIFSGIPRYTDLTAAGVTEKIAWIQHAVGQGVDLPELNLLMQRIVITNDQRSAANTLSEQWHITPPEALESPFALLGTVEAIAETLHARRARYGISYLTVFERDMNAFAPVVHRLTGT